MRALRQYHAVERGVLSAMWQTDEAPGYLGARRRDRRLPDLAAGGCAPFPSGVSPRRFRSFPCLAECPAVGNIFRAGRGCDPALEPGGRSHLSARRHAGFSGDVFPLGTALTQGLAGRTVRTAGIRSAGRAPELAGFITESERNAHTLEKPSGVWLSIESGASKTLFSVCPVVRVACGWDIPLDILVSILHNN